MVSFFKGLGIGLLCVVAFVLGLFFNVWFLSGAEKKGFSFTQELQSANKLTPDNFVSTPRFMASEFLSTKVSLNTAEKALIAKAFNDILERVAQDKICRGGSYTIEPTFSYKDGVETPKGQRVSASLSCKIKADELDAYNVLLRDIDIIATKSGFITMSMPALRASFSNELIKANEMKLREELIKTALATAENYSKLTNKQCELKNLDFSGSVAVPRSYLLSAKASVAEDAVADSVESAYSNALPVVGEEERTINAVGSYVCR